MGYFLLSIMELIKKTLNSKITSTKRWRMTFITSIAFHSKNFAHGLYHSQYKADTYSESLSKSVDRMWST